MPKEEFPWQDGTTYAHWLQNVDNAIRVYNRFKRYKYPSHRQLAEKITAAFADYESNKKDKVASHFAAQIYGMLNSATIKQRNPFKKNEDSFIYLLKQKAISDFDTNGPGFVANERLFFQKKELYELKKSLEEFQEKHPKLSEKIAKKKNKILKLKMALQHTKDILLKKEKYISDVEDNIKNDDGYKETLKQCDDLEKKLVALQTKFDEAEKTHQQMQKDLSNLEQENPQLKTINAKLEEKINKLEQNISNFPNIEEENKSLQSENLKHTLTIEQLKTQIHASNQELNKNSVTIKELSNSLAQQSKVVGDKQKQICSINQKNGDLSGENKELNEKNKKLTEENETLKKELEETRLDQDLKSKIIFVLNFFKKIFGENILPGKHIFQGREINIENDESLKLTDILNDKEISNSTSYTFFHTIRKKITLFNKKDNDEYPSAYVPLQPLQSQVDNK